MNEKKSEAITFNPSISRRIERLDKLRGLAIVMVLIAHWGVAYPPLLALKLGPIGVDVFFVISGFLIGLILLESKGQAGYYRSVYIRRVFRIMPLALVMIFTGLALQLISKGNVGSLWYYWAFIQNYIPAFLASNIDYHTEMIPLPTTSPMWSLAVVEHVYVIALIALVGVFLSLRTIQEYGGSWFTNQRETWNRMHYIAIGVLLCKREWWRYLFPVMAGWCALICAMNVPSQLIQHGIAIGICVQVWMVRGECPPIRNKYLAYLGKLCAGVYLLHYPIAAFFKELSARGYLNSPMSQMVSFFTYIVISVVLAVLSFKYFEMPIQRQRGRFEK
ncbi:MAG: acyltransferase [Rubritalea sp.]|uniref:acyltransferase family protein n=1 Tax=Rubritalea sp. TaxID=2109375 RepID=UPI0032421B97